jgi:hypothetical protein
MKTAILYLGVITNEQASRGYCLRSQQEVLSNYCNGKSYRTTKMNEAMSVIYLINKELKGNKKGKSLFKRGSSPVKGK